MTPTTKQRLASALAFAVLIVIAAWMITALLAFSPDGLTATIALTLALGAGIWAYVVNDLEIEAPRQYALKAIQYRPLLLSFGLFIALVILWGVGRAIVEWAVEPNMYDYGPCTRYFPHYPCGEQDLNSDRRHLAVNLVDKVTAGVFILTPMVVTIQRVRRVFQTTANPDAPGVKV